MMVNAGVIYIYIYTTSWLCKETRNFDKEDLSLSPSLSLSLSSDLYPFITTPADLWEVS